MKIRVALWLAMIVVAGACAPISFHGGHTPSECPTDGTVFAHGTCTLPDGVLPPVVAVVPGTASKVCTGPDTTMFECPAEYEPPTT